MVETLEFLSAKYRTKDICKAANISNGRLQNYFARGLVMGHRSVEGGGANNRIYRWPTLMEVAAATEMIAAGIPPKAAFFFAAEVAHAGHSEGDGLPARHPGFPFHHNLGDTLILATGDTAKIACDGAASFDTTFALRMMGNPLCYVTLNVTELFNTVCQRLETGQDYRSVLDAFYPEHAG